MIDIVINVIFRYALLSPQTWPHFRGRDVRDGVRAILNSVKMSQDEYQMGKTKLFIKAPESVINYIITQLHGLQLLPVISAVPARRTAGAEV